MKTAIINIFIFCSGLFIPVFAQNTYGNTLPIAIYAGKGGVTVQAGIGITYDRNWTKKIRTRVSANGFLPFVKKTYEVTAYPQAYNPLITDPDSVAVPVVSKGGQSFSGAIEVAYYLVGTNIEGGIYAGGGISYDVTKFKVTIGEFNEGKYSYSHPASLPLPSHKSGEVYNSTNIFAKLMGGFDKRVNTRAFIFAEANLGFALKNPDETNDYVTRYYNPKIYFGLLVGIRGRF